ncbi:MAG: TolC family protein [Candidatus Zixiibacteriota bacterium]
MKWKEFFILLIYILSISGIVVAQNKTIALDSLIEMALTNNPEIQNKKLSYEADEFRIKSAGVLPDPTITIAAMNLPRTSFRLDETPMSSILIGFSQPVPWLGKLKTKKAIAGLMAEIGAEEVKAKENDIAQMVKEAYYEFSYWSFAGQIVDTNSQLIELLIDISETRYANGLGSAQDYLRAQTSSSLLENKQAQINQMRQVALLRLMELTDNSSLSEMEIIPALPSEITLLDDQSRQPNPDLSKAGIKREISDRQLSLARKEYYPNLMFGLDYSIRKDMPMDAVRGEDFITARIGLQVPLWFFARQKNDVKAARYAIRAEERNYQMASNKLERMIASLKLNLTTLRENYNRYNGKIIPQAKTAYQAARVAYEVGEVDFNAILSAQMELLNIELDRYQILKEFWQKSSELAELYGTK